MRFRAHFDGRVIVPDEPVDLPVNQSFTFEIEPISSEVSGLAPTLEERQAALKRFMSRPLPRTAPLPDEATRRESIYADDDEQV